MTAGTYAGTNKCFRVVEHIKIEEIQKKSHGYFGLTVIGNVVYPLPIPLTV